MRSVMPEAGYQGQGQVITSHNICGMQILFPALDTCFWNNTPDIAVYMEYQSEYSVVYPQYKSVETGCDSNGIFPLYQTNPSALEWFLLTPALY